MSSAAARDPPRSHHAHPHLFALKVRLVHTAHRLGKFKNLFNPNHRHDEPHEQAIDKHRTSIAKSHRYESFAPVTSNNSIKYYVDGRDYFYAVSTALDSAKEVVYIADWWLSPELFLRRPPVENREWRLDRVLKRAAERGVKIYVIVYKEISAALTCNSAHTKQSMEALCPHGSTGHGNIVCMRHPDHSPLKHGADMTFYWAHHEKFILVDHRLAFVGGLDLCFGRWDTQQHPLADVHPTGVKNEVWPGQDFNNNRVMDFQKVEDWRDNQLDKKQFGRMPWHDVAVGFEGRAVQDVADQFVGRWNFIKRDKYKRNSKYPWLQLRGAEDGLLGVEHPRFPMGGYIKHPLHDESNEKQLENAGDAEIQIVRSASDWSHGISPKEHSIQNAYKSLIENAQHYIYIENQFFITATGPHQSPVNNTIGAALVSAISRAHAEKRKFRVIIVIPAIPGFPGDLRQDSATGTRAIIDYQYKSICRGPHSIFERLKQEGVEEPQEYIRFFNLRIYDRIHVTTAIEDREEDTGVKYTEVQAANAADVLGAGGVTQDDSSSSSSARSSVDDSDIATRRKLFESQLETSGENTVPPVKDTIAACAMSGQGRVSKQNWDKQDETELHHFIQEELYIHAKVLLVDDKFCIVGSANINDRSQVGDHDSEMAAVVHHPETVTALRKTLWAEHLGLSSPQDNQGSNDNPNCAPPGTPNAPPPDDPRLEDPLSNKLWKLWTGQAQTNTEIYKELFHADPDDCIRTWKDYDAFCPKREDLKAGHLWVGGNGGGGGDEGGKEEKRTVKEVKKMLGKIRGHLVECPLYFLVGEEMAEKGVQVNKITESIYT